MDENVEDVRRRQFLKLSGVAGLAVALGGFGTPAGAAAPTALQPNLCGSDTDTGPRVFIWAERAKKCGEAYRDPKKPPPPSYCLIGGRRDVVLHGGGSTTHDFLLVPTTRVKGIECPLLLGDAGRQYWEDAWNYAQPGAGPGAVTFPAGQLALGVNAAHTTRNPPTPVRKQDQLHIHMAGIEQSLVNQLTPIKSGVKQWRSTIIDVDYGGRKYALRGFRAPSFNENFFKLLHDEVVKPAGEDMATQMIIVTKAGNDWYVLNSNGAVRGPNNSGGTSACDGLLVYA
ncbi:CDP-diacylglycerol diphosphatase [Pseudonocardia alaniniphila]|uniref:CDP-diacylglycerol diphosphatase n=1 Tax=Pseudonocardia alaniniphila TaxID=75291 RepID=A0ABS9TCX5_9PSEU|nr:CDP-diacylglycerol diphosphatase [Pseudonocardia alaniniphila]MCH6166390.1 CDP-diacylglycerol diphosphatase [Pseudonocardia alaniniphila]